MSRKSLTSCLGWISATLSQNTQHSVHADIVFSPQTNTHSNISLPLCNPTSSKYFLCSLIYMASPLKEREWQRKRSLFTTRPEKKKPFLVIRWADRGDCLIGRDRTGGRWFSSITNGFLYTETLFCDHETLNLCYVHWLFSFYWAFTPVKRKSFLPAEMKQRKKFPPSHHHRDVSELTADSVNWTHRFNKNTWTRRSRSIPFSLR